MLRNLIARTEVRQFFLEFLRLLSMELHSLGPHVDLYFQRTHEMNITQFRISASELQSQLLVLK